MKKKSLKRLSILTSAALATLLIAPGVSTIISDIRSNIVYALDGNQVFFKEAEYEVGDSNIVYATLRFEGEVNDTIAVSYATKSGTAIEGIDFQGVTNSVSIKIPASHYFEYKIAVKCLDNNETREYFRVTEGDKNYGRYFSIDIVDTLNANVVETNKSCICRLGYNHKVEATTGLQDTILSREMAYLNDYKTMLMGYEDGLDDLDGGSTRKTWQHGIGFNNDTTRKWINTYINSGFADAYGSFVVKNIDEKWYDDARISVLFGNREFIEKYKRSSDCPGLSVYFKANPPGDRLDGRAMHYISQWINPYKKDKDLVDCAIYKVAENHKQIYWIVDRDTWFSSKNSIYDSEFYKIDPYNGVLDLGIAAYNHNDENDAEFERIWAMMTLYDSKCPVVTKQYCEYNKNNGALRIYLRFNEPVYTSKKQDLSVKINNYSTTYYAEYKEGNYGDTLVYEIRADDVPNVKIDSVTYQLPHDDIGDMAYKLDAYKQIQNNKVQNDDMDRSASLAGGLIDLTKPRLSVDIASSSRPRNSYNIILSANNNGATSFNTGTVYYTLDRNPYIDNPTSVLSYANKHELTSEEQGSFPLTLVKNESMGIISGDYYLHALAVSSYGFTAHDTFGPYRLDGDIPGINQLNPEVNGLKFKTYVFEIEDKPLGTGIKEVIACVKYKDNEEEKTSKLTIVSDGEIVTSLRTIISSTDEDGKTVYRYKSNIDGASIDVPEDNFIKGLLGEKQRLNIEIYFEVTDEAGNKGKSNAIKTVYDTRELFDNNVTAPLSYQLDDSIAVGCNVYNIHNATEEDGMTFEIANDEVKELIDKGAKYSVIINDETEIFAEQYSVTLKGLGAGYYDVVARISGSAEGTEVNMISSVTSFYLTNDMNDVTANKTKVNGNLVLTNHVYQLEDIRFYYFNPNNNAVETHLYGASYDPSTSRYQGGSSSPTFSSSIEAKKYVKYMEYQDLDLISITDTIASLLNSGSGSTVYVKAAKETMNAQAGQLWIRYKKSTWTDNIGSSGWAFYYYGEGKVSDGINVNNLSSNLNASIEAVVNRILTNGKDTYLVSEDNLNRTTNAPYLAESQIHIYEESVAQTKTGIQFVSNPTYAGDTNLYQNKVTIADTSYPIATNMPLSVSDNTSLFYKALGSDQWNPIEVEDGTLLKDALNNQASGIYTIREYTASGISEFDVYLDKSLPLLDVTLNAGLAEESNITLDGQVTTITCKSLSLNSLVNEADDLSFVAIYSYPNRTLITVLYQEAINGYILSGGNYYVRVGDRSGNVVTYTVLTSDSPIDMSVEENESKTAVIVKVNNRDDVEIYSYEVYLNENLYDNEFANQKVYRDSGVYRVEVTDIYGNKETRVLTHESPSPNLTWYYLNNNGGYSTYDPNNPVRLVLEDSQTSPRTTNVYSSTLVRILFNSDYENSDIEFEINGLNSNEYTYNDSTGLLSINSLSSWTMRVWYKDHPESDRTYIFNVDNSAPEITGTFIGTSYHHTVVYDENGDIVATASFDTLDFENYNEGDIATLDNLDYTIDGSSTLDFENGAIISGSHIVITVNDPSGIRSVSVTRNGQPMQAELNADNQLILNSYGTYVITITDNLGNVATYMFSNVETAISNAAVDGQIIDADIMYYGHDDIEIETLYKGAEAILIKTNGETVTYLFKYDEEKLTYGQYVITIDQYEDEEGNLVTTKTAQYVENNKFVLYNDDSLTKFNNWYTVIQDENYVVYAMIDENNRVHLKVACVNQEILVESYYTVGKTHLPNHYTATLSKEIPTVTLLTDGEEVNLKDNMDYIYITNELTIDKTSVSSNITKIEYIYSERPEFAGDYITIYENGAWLVDFTGSEFGFYQIIITNKYNNQTTYNISKIESFASVVTVYTLDGSEVTYYDNQGTIYSNYAIELAVYSDSVHFELNGKVTSGYYENGITTLTLNRDGVYTVKVVGDNGIFENFTFEIKNDETFLYQESWIIGYNEDALLYEQGYTNELCSIVLDDDVVYIDMVVNDDRHIILYDNITSDKQTDLNTLIAAIGRYGVGKYTVGFRNKYGDLVTKTVHYNNIPSLILTRAITSDPLSYQQYDLDFAIEKGFYSNYVLAFSTTSQTYEFTINEESYRLDETKRIEFTNINGKGSFSYRITYLDEYGNYVEFDAILYRADVEFDTSLMEVISMNSTLYTKDDICITFADGLKATLSIDGGEAKDYLSNEYHYADGEYKFVVRDIAGNNATYIINHKSMNHYTLTNSSTGEEIVDCGVINNAVVNFYSEDGSRIVYVIRNGELVENYNSNTFSITGHYEVMIEDMIGNLSYEEFYVLNNSLCEFKYTAPLDFEVTEVWRIKEDGTREMLNFKGPSITLNSNGDYVVVVTSTKTTSSFNFSVGIDTTAPTATLVGVEDGGVTARDVSISGLKAGDVVKVYKDGTLISTTQVGLSSDIPTITTGGNYRVTVTNVQGVTVEYNFTRKAIANVAGSIFIIVSSSLLVVGIGIGLVYHTKLKTDD